MKSILFYSKRYFVRPLNLFFCFIPTNDTLKYKAPKNKYWESKMNAKEFK